MKKLLSLTLIVVVLSMLVPVAAGAQASVTCAEEITVQKDDSLSNLADKYFVQRDRQLARRQFSRRNQPRRIVRQRR